MSVVPSTVASLHEQAAELLAVSVEALDQTQAGAPSRSYLAPSEPSFDCCPFLSVHVAALSEEATAAGPGGAALGHRATAGAVNLAAYVVHAVRCAPQWDGTSPPSVSEMERAASEVTEDGFALWTELRCAINGGRIFSTCTEVYFDGGTAIVEQGGCVGWRFLIRAAIPGIPCLEGS